MEPNLLFVVIAMSKVNQSQLRKMHVRKGRELQVTVVMDDAERRVWIALNARKME